MYEVVLTSTSSIEGFTNHAMIDYLPTFDLFILLYKFLEFFLLGKTGKQCYQNDECLSSPCEEDRVCKNIHPAEQIDKPYECVCADDDDVCKEKVTKGPMMPPMHIVYISGKLIYKRNLIYKFNLSRFNV